MLYTLSLPDIRILDDIEKAPDTEENFEINGIIQPENPPSKHNTGNMSEGAVSTSSGGWGTSNNDQQHILCHVCGEMHPVSGESNCDGKYTSTCIQYIMYRIKASHLTS